MGVNVKRLVSPGYLATTAATAYTVLPNKVAKDLELHFVNTDTTNTIGVTVYLVPTGGTAGATNTFLSESGAGAFLLSPGEARPWGTEQALTAGDFVAWKASVASKVVAHLSGKEVDQG